MAAASAIFSGVFHGDVSVLASYSQVSSHRPERLLPQMLKLEKKSVLRRLSKQGLRPDYGVVNDVRTFRCQAFSSSVNTMSKESRPAQWLEPLQENVSYVKKNWRQMLSLNHWVVRDYYKLVEAVNSLEPSIRCLSDEKLRGKTAEFRQRVQSGESLDAVQAEAFAVVREAARRVLGMRHFDVQIIGGAVLHDGGIAEMKTGEGKTLVSPLAAYLNSLTGRGVHVVTVNDYLAKRDAEWMGRIHRFLGLSVGLIQSNMQPHERKTAYACDITYSNNSELGFDYLRDHTCETKEDLVMRWPAPFNFAIVDEVDSVLIDEGRNPLLISSQARGLL